MKTAVFKSVNLNRFQHEFMHSLPNKTNGNGAPLCLVKKKYSVLNSWKLKEMDKGGIINI